MNKRRVYESDRAVRTGGQSFRPARKVDLDEPPPGYDPDLWDMALLFELLATRRGIRLSHGRILLYAMLEPRMEWLRDQRARVDETRRGSWSADGVIRFSSWQEMGRAAIGFFWEDTEDILTPNDPGPHAASEFCNEVEFKAIIWETRQRAISRHSRTEFEKKVNS